MNRIEQEYQRLIDAMTPSERLQRSIGMASWARQVIAGQIIAEEGEMSDQRLKWKVALRLYGTNPVMSRMIESRLADVPL